MYGKKLAFQFELEKIIHIYMYEPNSVLFVRKGCWLGSSHSFKECVYWDVKTSKSHRTIVRCNSPPQDYYYLERKGIFENRRGFSGAKKLMVYDQFSLPCQQPRLDGSWKLYLSTFFLRDIPSLLFFIEKNAASSTIFLAFFYSSTSSTSFACS